MGFSRPKRFDMAITFEEVVFNKDEIIIRQGEKANFFYIIVHG
jgi:CRP-like cAMP-binding protein